MIFTNIFLKKLEKAITVGLNSDCWTSISNDSYLSLTCHWVNEDLKMDHCLLAMKYCQVSHTSANLSQEIKNICNDWNITKKVILIFSFNIYIYNY
jgi:zinc finger BED domain-containing protein 1 (E3 SUMO-protein ligase ZBED1)